MKRLLFVLWAALATAIAMPSHAQQAAPTIAGMNGGGAHNVMLRADGTVWAWGDNGVGQLGNGSYDSTWRPQLVALPQIIKVAAGQKYSLALAADGRTVYAFGDNSLGELGVGNSRLRRSSTPVVVAIDLPPAISIVDIADGGNHALALLSNGHVVAWGANEHGQAGQDPKIYGNVLYTPMLVPNVGNVSKLAAGDHATLALLNDGSLWAWGGNKYGQLGPLPAPSESAATFRPVQVPGLPAIDMIATGGEDSVAVDFNGYVYTWGRNEFGELGRGNTDPADGPHPTPKRVPTLQNIVSVDGEGPTTLAADVFGNIYAFGFNKNGEVGNGMTENTGTPTLVLSIPRSDVASGPSVQVSAGHFFSYAFNVVTGTMYSWGQNDDGQLGVPANDVPNARPLNLKKLLGLLL